jgi:hypothetical protein
MHFNLIRSPCRVSESSAGELPWVACLIMLDRVVFGRAHTYCFLHVWFQREHGEALFMLPLWDMPYGPWWSLTRRMVWKLSFWWLAMMVQVFVAMRNLLGDFWIVTTASECGGDNTGEVQSPILQSENPRSSLNFCAWQWPCWMHCFVSKNFLWDKNYDLWSRDDDVCAPFSEEIATFIMFHSLCCTNHHMDGTSAVSTCWWSNLLQFSPPVHLIHYLLF